MANEERSRRGKRQCCTCDENSISFLHPVHEPIERFEQKSLADILKDIANIDLKSGRAGDVAQSLCGNCSRKLKSAYAFVLQARRVNERWLAGDLSGGDYNEPVTKHLDCLLETPIEIKMETEFDDDSFYETFNVMNAAEEEDFSDGKASKQYRKQEQSNETATEAFMKMEEPSTSNAAQLKKDPFAIVENNWQADGMDERVETDDRNFCAADDKSESKQSEDESSASEPEPKRRRGRPRLAKKGTKRSREGRFKCDVCNKTFAWRKDLRRHTDCHFAAPSYDCDDCGRQFVRKDKFNDHLKIHRKQHGTQQMARSIQLRVTRRQSEWNFAERLYTDGGFRQIQCKLCGGRFEATQTLRNHMEREHLDASTLVLGMESDIVKELFPQVQNIDEIKAVISEDITRGRFTRYYAIVNEFGYEMCLSDSDADADANPDGVGAAAKKKYECELCHEKFARKHHVFAHIRTMHALEPLPHRCTVCKVGFVCERMLSQHTRTQCRSKEKKYQCLKCPGKFMWLENLEAHQCSNRFNSPEYRAQKRDILQCHICDTTFARTNDLKRHMETHGTEDDTHDCAICCQRFLKADHLRHHIRTAHEQLKRRLKCCLCGERRERLEKLRQHLLLHADGSTRVDMTPTGQFAREYYPEGCAGREVDVASTIADDFASGDLSRYYSAIDESGNELDVDDSESDGDLESQAAYTCDVCSSTFQRRKHLLLHQHSEHGEMSALPHACTECSKQFVCAALLQRHLSRDCRNRHKRLQCEKCSVRFVWAENLELHMQLKHIDPEQQISRQLANKLQCDQCDKVFIWAKDLTRHLRIHMPDDEKYTCPYCERKFNRKDNMLTHLRRHGDDVYESTLKKEPTRLKPVKLKGVDPNLCKPHGCKVIRCMICLSKHTKIADLRTHLRTHQYAVSFAQRLESVDELSALLYPDEPPSTSHATLIERVQADIAAQHYERFFSITNESGYELNLDSSETESNYEADDDDYAAGSRSYSCELCSAPFTRKYKLFEHQRAMHDWSEAPHGCTHCNGRFMSAVLLQAHLADQCENSQKRFVCRKCPRRFRWRDNLKAHVRTLHAGADDAKSEVCAEETRHFECHECGRRFRMRKDLTRHINMYHSDAPVFKCSWCPRKFYRQDNMHTHIRRHGLKPDDIAAAECIIQVTCNANGTKQICCKVCNLQFASIAELRVHLENGGPHHSVDNLLNYSITNERGFELHIDDSETDADAVAVGDENRAQPLYTCVLCKLSRRRKYEMAQHQRSVHKHEQLPLQCDKCVFRTVSLDILEHHKRTQCYNAEKQFECAQCHFKFMWAENLQAHVRLQHTQTTTPLLLPSQSRKKPDDKQSQQRKGKQRKPTHRARIFECDLCPCKYNRKDRLNAHKKKLHAAKPASATGAAGKMETPTIVVEQPKRATIEKKYLCAFCGRALTSSSNLIIHMRRHTGEKPFKCDLCDMAFPRSSDMQCHRRTHTGEKPHRCSVCDKAFSRSYKLYTHMRIHSGERPYKCTYCEKSFTQSNDLTLHIRRHTGERPYVCGICGERFIQGTALKNHRTQRGHYEEGPDVPRRPTLLELF